MQVFLLSVLALCSAVTATVSGQINPLFFLMGEGGDDMLGMNDNGMSLWLYNSLQRRIVEMERKVQSGAIGGCESGVIGPFTPGQMSGIIKFQKPFLGGPAVSLALSDLQVADASLNINLQIRPSEIKPMQASIAVTDATNATSSVHVSYMVCPSNAYAPKALSKP